MKALQHEMILASAGSGKTYALTNRFVRLLAHGAAPERIVALTFTRKAAGEFFDEILKKLASAATDSKKAEKLAAEIGAPTFVAADFLRLLRGVVTAMPRLNLGTLDGFFARVVQNFPLELGLDGEFQILEAAASARERRRVLRRMFTASGEPDAAQREFIEAFKRATFGVEEKRLTRVLDRFLNEHGEKYLAASAAAQWGDPVRIWPAGCSWLAAVDRRKAAAQALCAAWATEPWNEKQRARVENFFAALEEWAPGAPLPKPLDYMLKSAFEAWPALEEIIIERRKITLSEAARAALRGVVEGIAGAELKRRLEMTRGIFAVLRGYEMTYDALVRRAGRLTFTDVLRRLLPGEGAPSLAQMGDGVGRDAEEARLLIDWRLDAKFDHWLLDEFQDTSYEQWSVLRNLIDEALQDAEGRRSLFYVGDVKQAIYAWRGGDPRLFREIFNHYNNSAPGKIVEGRLDVSWRSAPAVIAMVNAVFGASELMLSSVPATAAKEWNREWRVHASADEAGVGFAELRHAPDELGRFAETLKILREVEPARRGLTVAVLVQQNSTATALAEYLRREGGVAALAESDLRVATDNPLTVALLALLRAAAFPGDTLAREHVRMSPLESWLKAEGLVASDALTLRVLTEVQALGFAGTLEGWLRLLELELKDDKFSLERGRLLVAAAERFDEGGSRDVAEFLEFAEGYTVREADTLGGVRVMTVHKAKGLGFDLVILPDLEGETLASRRGGLAVQRAQDRSVEWVLDLPNKVFAQHEPVLASHMAAAESEAAYENLCLLYVAMTRAKRAMILVTEPTKKTSTSQNFTRLLHDALGETWGTGEALWFQGFEFKEPKPAAENEVSRVTPIEWVRRTPRRPARTPSALKQGGLSGSLVFALKRSEGADFGTAVHERFAEVKWLDGSGQLELCAEAWRERFGSENESVAEALACMGASTLASVWVKPTSSLSEVWCERAFEMVLDGAWVTGVFDRVVVERDESGAVTRAVIIDYKTDRVATDEEVAAAVERHAGQLNLYRRVVAVLARVPVGQVECCLVFTRLRRMERVVAAR
ncbi:MAG: UvrD-helicase domain-containing protein [Opitutaceae bacterium]